MGTKYMITNPRERESIEEVKLLQFFLEHDIKQWIIAKETGRLGYKHWQIRIDTNLSFKTLQVLFPKAHIEKCSDSWTYERKEGNFLSSEDTLDVLKVRFGQMTERQERVMRIVDKQNDRQIALWLDTKGNRGKSWLVNHLYEQGRAFYCPPWIDSVKGIIQFIASGYKGEEYIIIDIPRSWRWSKELYTAIESIKDGLVCDTRYSARTRNIRGCKVLVMSNTEPKLDALSIDRWLIIDG